MAEAYSNNRSDHTVITSCFNNGYTETDRQNSPTPRICGPRPINAHGTLCHLYVIPLVCSYLDCMLHGVQSHH